MLAPTNNPSVNEGSELISLEKENTCPHPGWVLHDCSDDSSIVFDHDQTRAPQHTSPHDTHITEIVLALLRGLNYIAKGSAQEASDIAQKETHGCVLAATPTTGSE
jgi:hypothetical protein